MQNNTTDQPNRPLTIKEKAAGGAVISAGVTLLAMGYPQETMCMVSAGMIGYSFHKGSSVSFVAGLGAAVVTGHWWNSPDALQYAATYSTIGLVIGKLATEQLDKFYHKKNPNEANKAIFNDGTTKSTFLKSSLTTSFILAGLVYGTYNGQKSTPPTEGQKLFKDAVEQQIQKERLEEKDRRQHPELYEKPRHRRHNNDYDNGPYEEEETDPEDKEYDDEKDLGSSFNDNAQRITWSEAIAIHNQKNATPKPVV